MGITSALRAQNVHVDAFIKNKYTNENIDSVTVTFMTRDSVVVEQIMAKPLGWWQLYTKITEPGDYIVRFSKEGYFDTYVNKKLLYIPHRKNGDSLGTVYMRRKSNEQVLKEAVVNATKIKMVVKGDTIIYNADAFQMEQGSMLDKLIAALPGMTLDRSGVITVNGRRVSSLLVNGEDFFRGDPRVALENLPAYMVDKVKVYEQGGGWVFNKDRTEAYKLRDQPLVVDVNLKKQYSIGWIANAGAGYGTDRHWAARAFALRFTPRTRLAFTGTSNDVMGNGSYNNENGNWNEPMGNANQIMTTNQAGADLLVKDREEKFKMTGNAIFRHTKTRDEMLSSTVTFLSPDHIYGRNRFDQTFRSATLESKWDIAYRKDGRVQTSRKFRIQLRPEFYYNHYDNRSGWLKADFLQQLSEQYMGEALDSLFSAQGSARFRQHLVSAIRQQSAGRGHQWNTGIDASAGTGFRRNLDYLSFGFGGKYTRMSSLNREHVQPLGKGNNTSRFATNDTRNYNWHASTSYSFYLFNLFNKGFALTLEPTYSVRKTYDSDRRPYYLLENTDYEEWSLDRLASTKTALMEYMDAVNSYYSVNNGLSQSPGLNINLYDFCSKWRYNLDLELITRLDHDRMNYQRAAIDTVCRRDNAFFEPHMKLTLETSPTRRNKVAWTHKWTFDYHHTHTAPALLSLLDYYDDATPLVVRRGNPGLRNTRKHRASLQMERNNGNRQVFHTLSADYTLWINSVSQELRYDVKTGVSTYRPVNINGNWQATARYDLNLPLTKDKSSRLTSSLDGSYRRSADMQSFGLADSRRNSIDRYALTERINAYYYRKGYQFIFNGAASWVHARGTYTQRLNAVDYDYGCYISGPTRLWGISFSTNLHMYSRRGYSDRNFNTDQFVWNASLTKSVMHGNLDINIRAFDILDQLSNRSYSVNAQMQTEAYYNVLRRYVMLQLTYKFNREPKKN